VHQSPPSRRAGIHQSHTASCIQLTGRKTEGWTYLLAVDIKGREKVLVEIGSKGGDGGGGGTEQCLTEREDA